MSNGFIIESKLLKKDKPDNMADEIIEKGIGRFQEYVPFSYLNWPFSSTS